MLEPEATYQYGPTAVLQLLLEFAAAPGDTMVNIGIASADETPDEMLLVVQLDDDGYRVAMPLSQAAAVQQYCSLTPPLARLGEMMREPVDVLRGMNGPRH